MVHGRYRHLLEYIHRYLMIFMYAYMNVDSVCVCLCTGIILYIYNYIHNRSKYYSVRERCVYISIICISIMGMLGHKWESGWV